MNTVIGTKFFIGNTQYIVDKVEAFDPKLTSLIKAITKSGKDAAMYFASKVLKSGKQSKQGGMFYRCSKSGNFIKVV